MDKVTIEITKDGWKLNAKVGEFEFTDVAVMKSAGRATHEGDDIDDMEWINDDLYDALTSFFPFEVAQALYRLSE